MSTFEVEFPKKVAQGATGGPGFSTQINQGFSGFEQRQGNWSQFLNKWSLTVAAQQGADTSRLTDFDTLRTFMINVAGMRDVFRFYDPIDHSATAQLIGTGDGTNRIFQLVKSYSIGGRTYTRTITKPITSSVKDYLGNSLTNTVKIYDNGSLVSTSLWDVDYVTGLVTSHTGHAPASTHLVTADFDFHTPVRFGSDDFRAIIQAKTQTVAAFVTVSVELVEVRLA